MTPRLARRLTLALLCAGAAFSSSSCKSSVPQPGQVQSVGTRIDVLRATKASKGQRVDVRVKIWNDHESRINFGLGSVGLEAKGRRVSPTPSLTKIQNPDVQQNANATFDWCFEVGEPLGAGSYTIRIVDVQKGGAPLGEDIEFKINLGA